MKSIVTIGESVVNLVCSGEGASLENARSFEKVPGGAPANVAAAVSRLGGSRLESNMTTSVRPISCQPPGVDLG